MSDELSGKRIAFLVANEGVEQVELSEPARAVREAGAEADLIAPADEPVQAFSHLDKGDNLVTSRKPDDLGAFNSNLIEALAGRRVPAPH